MKGFEIFRAFLLRYKRMQGEASEIDRIGYIYRFIECVYPIAIDFNIDVFGIESKVT